jgi:ribosomal protein S18 acetylase RimI-like enzyme
VFDRFTDAARSVVVRAQVEARTLGHTYIGTEHLLLGLLDEGGIASQALGTLGLALGMARERVVEIVGRDGSPAGSHIPFTPRAKGVLLRSLDEARRLDRQRIGPEDILLALASEGDGVAAEILRNAGVTATALGSVLAQVPRPVPRPPRGVRLRSMSEEEFTAYLSWVVDDYAAELERNGQAVGDAALEASRASFSSLLPDGVNTSGQVLLIASEPDEGRRLGVLWFGPSNDDASTAWIYDITVDEGERGHGWGRAIMRAFEREARARGYTRAGLNVYADNHIARRLYETLGYLETARQLHKELSGEDPLGS